MLELVREKQGDKDQHIFCPLMNADGLGDCLNEGTMIAKIMHRSNVFALECEQQSGVGFATIGSNGCSQQWQINACIAYIIEAFKTPLQFLKFAISRQVLRLSEPSVPAKIFKCAATGMGQSLIGSSDKVDARPLRFS